MPLLFLTRGPVTVGRSIVIAYLSHSEVQPWAARLGNVSDLAGGYAERLIGSVTNSEGQSSRSSILIPDLKVKSRP